MSVSRRRVPAACILLAVALLSGCLSANINESTVEQANKNAPTQPVSGALPATPVIGSTDYRVGPLDVLDVEVFSVPDLTKSVRISVGGEFTMPLVGTIPAAGKTVGEIEKEIAARLKDGFMENPQVTVFVKEYMSQRVTVEGAVREPGIFSLTGRTSLLQVVAMCKGLDELANPGGVVIYRNIEGRRYAAAFDIREIRAGRLIDPEVLGSDIVVVDFSGVRSNLKDFLYTRSGPRPVHGPVGMAIEQSDPRDERSQAAAEAGAGRRDLIDASAGRIGPAAADGIAGRRHGRAHAARPMEHPSQAPVDGAGVHGAGDHHRARLGAARDAAVPLERHAADRDIVAAHHQPGGRRSPRHEL